VQFVWFGDRNPPQRTPSDPQPQTDRLLQSLDAKWTEHQASYVPSAAEQVIIQELGILQQTVMLFALQTPALQQYDVDTQVLPGSTFFMGR